MKKLKEIGNNLIEALSTFTLFPHKNLDQSLLSKERWSTTSNWKIVKKDFDKAVDMARKAMGSAITTTAASDLDKLQNNFELSLAKIDINQKIKNEEEIKNLEKQFRSKFIYQIIAFCLCISFLMGGFILIINGCEAIGTTITIAPLMALIYSQIHISLKSVNA